MKSIRPRLSFGIFLRNLPFFISACATVCLNATTGAKLIFGVICLAAIAVLAAGRQFRFSHYRQEASPLTWAIALLLSLLMGFGFQQHLSYRDIVLQLTQRIQWNSVFLVGALAVIGAAASVFSMAVLCHELNTRLHLPQESIAPTPSKRGRVRDWMVCLFAAFVSITLCSKSSPLYPLNDWVDSNCYLTVGKAMLQGVVPYRDLYEQKGPILYFLHTLAALVSYRTFFGVYLLEIVAAFAFVRICHKTMELFVDSPSPLWMLATAALVYTAGGFLHGDSAEEFCLPLMAYGLYLGLKLLRQDRIMTWAEGIWLGITSGAILWVKFSMLGFYLGWFAVYAVQCLKQNAIKDIFRALAAIALGVGIISLPVLVYFGTHGALKDLFVVYFFNNLFRYPITEGFVPNPGLLWNLVSGKESFRGMCFAAYLSLIVGFLALRSSGLRKEAALVGISGLTMFLLTYAGGRIHRYYCLIFSVYLPIGLLYLRHRVKQLRIPGFLRNSAVVGLCFTVLCYIGSNNTYLLGTPRSELPQYQFAEIINQKEDATLLNYGFLDGGFYTTTGIVPHQRYFCKLNIPLAEMDQAQKACIEEGLADFVVTRDVLLEDAPHYCLVAESALYFEEAIRTYYLYALIPEEP